MATSNLRSIGVTFLPFTPVTFDGPDALYAWARVLLYGAASTLMWKRHRPTAYALAGAAGLSLLTSLSGTAYAKNLPTPNGLAVESASSGRVGKGVLYMPQATPPTQAEIDELIRTRSL